MHKIKPHKLISIAGLSLAIALSAIERNGVYFIEIIIPTYVLSLAIELLSTPKNGIPKNLQFISFIRDEKSAKSIGWILIGLLTIGWLLFVLLRLS
jgi:hypothetical protein